MSYYRVIIPGWHPTLTNSLFGHPMAAYRRKKKDTHQIWLAQLHYRIPPAKGKRSVKLTIVLGKGQRAGDPDNYWKSFLDAATKARWILDDRRQCVETPPVQFERAELRATVVEIEDIVETGGQADAGALQE